MEGAAEGYKIKFKALKKEKDSLESKYKKQIYEIQRGRNKGRANVKAETFAKGLLCNRLRLNDAQSPFSAPSEPLGYFIVAGTGAA